MPAFVASVDDPPCMGSVRYAHMSHQFPIGEPLNDELTHELLSDLEELNQTGIRLTRDTASLSIKAPVEVRSGDVCARRTVLVKGTTRV